MFATPTERSAAFPADLEAGAFLLAGPATVAEVEAAALLLTSSAGVLALSGFTGEVVAVIGALVWVVALLVLVALDVARAARRARLHQRDRHLPRRRLPHQSWVRR